MWGVQGDYVLQGNDQWGNGKILLLPTVIVNKHQYRGRLDVPSILRALCAGFSETTEPEVCTQCILSHGHRGTCAHFADMHISGSVHSIDCRDLMATCLRPINTSCKPCSCMGTVEAGELPVQVCLAGSMQEDDCAAETHSCWVHTEGKQSFSACKDTFRGYVCQCPEGAAPCTLNSLHTKQMLSCTCLLADMPLQHVLYLTESSDLGTGRTWNSLGLMRLELSPCRLEG